MKPSFTCLSKAVFATLALALSCTMVFAQSFTVSPSNTITQTVYEGVAANLQIDLNNTSGSDIVFEWETVSNTFDTAWTNPLCDYQACFPGIPASGTMTAVPDGQYGFIKITVIARENLGPGQVVFNVWPSGNTSAMETLTFNVDAVVGIEETDFDNAVQLYPNPATDRLFIRNTEATHEAGLLQIIDFSGALVMEKAVTGSDVQSLDISNLPQGVYVARFQLGENSTSRRILKAN